MEKTVLTVTDPRDAFMIMLSERMGDIEARLTKLEKVENIESRLEFLESEHAKFEMKNPGYSSEDLVKTFLLTIKNIEDVEDIDTSSLPSVKNDCEIIVNSIISQFGDGILTASAIIEHWSFGDQLLLDVYIKVNMKRKCFFNKIVHMISEIKLPRHIEISAEPGVVRYNHHVSKYHDDGLVFNAYDICGDKVACPEWTNWTNSCELYV